jgi:hypothetical protein
LSNPSDSGGTNSRQHERVPLTSRIRITHESFGSVVVKTRDISLGGVYLIVDDLTMPPPGTVIEGQIQDEMEDRPVVRMEVVRIEPNGVGLKFLA